MNADTTSSTYSRRASLQPKLDYLHREVQQAAGRPLSRRQALGLGGMALLAGAVGCTTSTSPTSSGPRLQRRRERLGEPADGQAGGRPP